MISPNSFGTKHRNHCPWCLYSRHVDASTPGDRAATCRARMQVMGLALKNEEFNPLTNRTSGELMLIHKCLGCGRISPNRIAGDDNCDAILAILDMEGKPVVIPNIQLLTYWDHKMVEEILYGY